MLGAECNVIIVFLTSDWYTIYLYSVFREEK